MRSRPVFPLDSLRFGPIHDHTGQHCRSRFAGVVSSITYSGNCMGVPTIGNEGPVFHFGENERLERFN